MSAEPLVETEPMTSERFLTIHALLSEARSTGLTWRELDDLAGWHNHGRTSGALSNMHRDGLIVRLTERRDRCSIYVLPEFVEGRESHRQGRMTTCPTCDAYAAMYESALLRVHELETRVRELGG